MSLPRVSERTLLLPASVNDVVDVLLDGRRVFSLKPEALEVVRKGRRTGWPPALRPYLRGKTEVTLVSHLSGKVLTRSELRFPGDGRVRVEDENGTPLSLNKWGFLQPSFATDPSGKRLMIEDARDLLTFLNDRVGMSAYVAYGALLGAVRGGDVIGHDTDVDIAYYSDFEHPADLMRESLRLERLLRAAGWSSRRRSGGFFQVSRTAPGEPVRHVDIFASYHMSGWFSLHQWVRGRLPRGAILPLSQVPLGDLHLPAPHDPEALLGLTYGEGWRIPDPSFRFEYPAHAKNRAEPWFGGWRRDKTFWRGVLRQSAPDGSQHGASAFAQYVDARLRPGATVVDLGCGAGSDALWFARDGRPVVGVDYVDRAITRANAKARLTGASVQFEAVSLYDLRSVLALGARLAGTTDRPVLYARHLLDTLRPDGRQNFWFLAKLLLTPGGDLFLQIHEPRSGGAAVQQHTQPRQAGLTAAQVAHDVAQHRGVVTDSNTVVEYGGEVSRLRVSFGC